MHKGEPREREEHDPRTRRDAATGKGKEKRPGVRLATCLLIVGVEDRVDLSKKKVPVPGAVRSITGM